MRLVACTLVVAGLVSACGSDQREHRKPVETAASQAPPPAAADAAPPPATNTAAEPVAPLTATASAELVPPPARAESVPPPEWTELPTPAAPVATTHPVVALAPPRAIAPFNEPRRQPVNAPPAVEPRDAARSQLKPAQPAAKAPQTAEPAATAAPAPTEARPVGLDRDDLQVAQETLASQGFYRGPLDGVFGAEMQDAVTRYQRGHGLRETATLDAATLARLDADQVLSSGAAGVPVQATGSGAAARR